MWALVASTAAHKQHSESDAFDEMILTLALALAAAGGAGADSSELSLSSSTTGALLARRSDEGGPWAMPFGGASTNVSGLLLQPPTEQLCAGTAAETASWRGRVLLGNDWTTGGCSVETRARAMQAAGAAGAIFVGTEGLPFDWDGSARGDITLPVVALGRSSYALLTDAVANATGAPLLVRLSSVETPLLRSPAFAAADRCAQALFFVWTLLNMGLCVRQLLRFVRAKQERAIASTLPASAVITIELASSLFQLIFIIDGPGLEKTRPAVFPFIVDRIALALAFEFHMIATLVISSHFRQLLKRVASATDGGDDAPPNWMQRRGSWPTGQGLRRGSWPVALGGAPAEPGLPPADLSVSGSAMATSTSSSSSSGTSDSGSQRRVSPPPVIAASTRRGLRGSVANLRVSMTTKLRLSHIAPPSIAVLCHCSRHDNLFLAMMVLMCVTDLAVATLSALYLGNEDVILYSTMYISAVMLFIGLWFFLQGRSIVTRLKRSEADKKGSGSSRVHRLARNVQRIGALTVCNIFTCIVGETVRTALLQDEGGWPYWAIYHSAGCTTVLLQTWACTYMVLAFQPPGDGAPSRASKIVRWTRGSVPAVGALSRVSAIAKKKKKKPPVGTGSSTSLAALSVAHSLAVRGQGRVSELASSFMSSALGSDVDKGSDVELGRASPGP